MYPAPKRHDDLEGTLKFASKLADTDKWSVLYKPMEIFPLKGEPRKYVLINHWRPIDRSNHAATLVLINPSARRPY